MTTTYGNYVPIERTEKPKRNGLLKLAEVGAVCAGIFYSGLQISRFGLYCYASTRMNSLSEKIANPLVADPNDLSAVLDSNARITAQIEYLSNLRNRWGINPVKRKEVPGPLIVLNN